MTWIPGIWAAIQLGGPLALFLSMSKASSIELCLVRVPCGNHMVLFTLVNNLPNGWIYLVQRAGRRLVQATLRSLVSRDSEKEYHTCLCYPLYPGNTGSVPDIPLAGFKEQVSHAVSYARRDIYRPRLAG